MSSFPARSPRKKLHEWFAVKRSGFWRSVRSGGTESKSNQTERYIVQERQTSGSVPWTKLRRRARIAFPFHTSASVCSRRLPTNKPSVPTLSVPVNRQEQARTKQSYITIKLKVHMHG